MSSSRDLTVAATASAPAAPIVVAQAGPEGELSSLWVALLEAVGRASPFARTYLVEAHPVSLAKGVLTIGFDPESENIDLVNNPKNHTLLQTKLAELGHTGTQVKFIKAERPEGWTHTAPALAPAAGATAPASAPSSGATKSSDLSREPAATRIEEFKNDPLIQKALEMFRGQIVEVRA